MRDSRDEREAEVDEDRGAILRRRQRWIALALSGASLAAASGCDSAPTACLSIAIDAGPDGGEEPDAGDGERDAGGSDGGP